MSGRLVILRHKRWNVWNQDNVERVLRDERLESERLERERQRERRAEQDARYAALTGGGPQGVGGRLRLLEREESAPGNEEAERERREAELRHKRREGVAPWALGEGSVEKLRSKPWQFSARSEAASQDEVRRARDDRQKAALDPMASFTRRAAPKEGAGESRHGRQVNSPPSASEGDVLAALRKRRLNREAAERRRARELLSLASEEHSGNHSKSENYHEQFNPRRKHARIS